MKILITGGAGFVAGYLQRELESAGHDVFLSDIGDCDLTDSAAVTEMMRRVLPDAVFHLGGISFVPDAAKDSNLLMRVNVDGTRNILQAMVETNKGQRDNGLPTFVLASTILVTNEPISLYATSKLKAEKVVHEYADRVNGVIARLSNHTGPKQSQKFVVPSFIQQAKEIKSGKRKKFSVGNLDSVRDFTDVRDVTKAYRILLERGKTGLTYAIGSNYRITMRQLLENVAKVVGVPTDYEINPAFWRPTDESKPIDTTSIAALGWHAQIDFMQTLSDIAAS